MISKVSKMFEHCLFDLDSIVSERDPITPFLHDTHAISSENPLEKYNPYTSKSNQSNKSHPTEVENVIDVSSGEESNS